MISFLCNPNPNVWGRCLLHSLIHLFGENGGKDVLGVLVSTILLLYKREFDSGVCKILMEQREKQYA